MPLLTLHMNYDSDQVAGDLARGLSELTAQILRKDPAKIVVRIVTDGAQASWYANATRITDGSAIVSLSILVTKGTNSELEKSQWIDAAWRLLSERLGPLQGSNYISVVEIDAMSWGYDGITQHRRSKETNTAKELV